MTHLDLFSGIGGFALAARWAGIETIAFAETDEYCSAVLRKHWPGVPNYGDVRNVRGVRADLVTGGFPCQPFSLAGKRRGTSDDRYLWPEMLAVIADCGAAWVLAENVPGIIQMELDRVLSDLESIGYTAWPLVIPACAVDAKHVRKRVWILAHSERDGSERGRASRKRKIGAGSRDEAEGPSERPGNVANTESRRGGTSRAGENQSRPNVSSCGSSEALADADRSGPQGRGCTILPERRAEWPARASGSSLSDTRHGGSEGPWSEFSRQQEPSWWEPEPQLGRVATGIPNRVDRLRALGNSIVPQVAYQILKGIAEVESCSS